MINWSWYLLICAFFPFLGDGGKRRANVRIPPKANVAVLLHHLPHDDRHQDYQCHDHLYHHHHQIASPYDTRNMHSLASHTRPCTFPRRRSGPVPEQKEEKMVIISVENIDDKNYYISTKYNNKIYLTKWTWQNYAFWDLFLQKVPFLFPFCSKFRSPF